MNDKMAQDLVMVNQHLVTSNNQNAALMEQLIASNNRLEQQLLASNIGAVLQNSSSLSAEQIDKYMSVLVAITNEGLERNGVNMSVASGNALPTDNIR